MTNIKNSPFKVYLVGPDEFVMTHLVEALSDAKELELTGPEANHSAVVSTFRRSKFDVIILDIGVKGMYIQTLIRRLCKIDPRVKIIMASGLSFPNVKRGMECLLTGAVEFIITPAELINKKSPTAYKKDLIQTISKFARQRRAEGKYPEISLPKAKKPTMDSFTFRPETSAKPKYLAIGSSTGGPNALFEVLSKLPASFSAPILITQHMPANFTPILAKNLAGKLGKMVKEAENGEIVQNNHIYIAPGNFHMSVQQSGSDLALSLSQGPHENSCRPSVEPLFRSLAKYAGEKCLAVVLTGMGQDGSKGCSQLANAGSTVIAQDFDSSVVWGMPGAAVETGACSKVLPLNDIASYIIRKFG